MTRFVDWQWEYEAFTTNRVVISLDEWTQVQITGSDRVKFLHNMCTNDVLRLEIGQMREAFCTDVKGKIIAHTLVIAAENHLVLLTIPGQSERLIAHLDHYIIREDVQLIDVNQSYQWQYVVGPRAVETATAGDGFSVPCGLLWPGGFLIRGEAGSRVGDAIPAAAVGSPAFTALRVESFWPLYGTDFDNDNLPQEINRDDRAISFTKGCYLGQETVARIDSLGHVNKKLVLVKISGEEAPKSGAKLSSDSVEVGVITSSMWCPKLASPMALAMIKREYNEVGTRLHCETQLVEVVDAR